MRENKNFNRFITRINFNRLIDRIFIVVVFVTFICNFYQLHDQDSQIKSLIEKNKEIESLTGKIERISKSLDDKEKAIKERLDVLEESDATRKLLFESISNELKNINEIKRDINNLKRDFENLRLLIKTMTTENNIQNISDKLTQEK